MANGKSYFNHPDKMWPTFEYFDVILITHTKTQPINKKKENKTKNAQQIQHQHCVI